LTSGDGLEYLIGAITNKVLDSQMSEHVSALPSERLSERKGCRTRMTCCPDLEIIRVPQSRIQTFRTDLFRRSQGSDNGIPKKYILIWKNTSNGRLTIRKG